MPKNARGTTAYTPVRARYVYGNSRDREKPLRYPERCLGAQVGPYFFVPEKEREREQAVPIAYYCLALPDVHFRRYVPTGHGSGFRSHKKSSARPFVRRALGILLFLSQD